MNERAAKRFTKTTLPTKPCIVCGRPFAWRKRWARVWDEVKYCSDRCRASKGATPQKALQKQPQS